MELQLKVAYLTAAVGVFLGMPSNSHASQPSLECPGECEDEFFTCRTDVIEYHEAAAAYCYATYTGSALAYCLHRTYGTYVRDLAECENEYEVCCGM